MVKPQAQEYRLNGSAISNNEYFSMMKRMGELEEKVITLSNKPSALPPEKEEMLNNVMSHVDKLEQELCATKMVLSINSVVSHNIRELEGQLIYPLVIFLLAGT